MDFWILNLTQILIKLLSLSIFLCVMKSLFISNMVPSVKSDNTFHGDVSTYE